MPKVELRCPFCNARGVNQLEAKTVGFFAIIYCRQCGAIHGVIPKPPTEQPPKPVETSQPEPVTPKEQPEPFDIRKIDVKAIDAENIDIEKPKPEPTLTPARAHAMMQYHVQPGSTMYRIIKKDDKEG